MTHRHMADSERAVGRNPHPDFKQAEASRENWTPRDWTWTKTKSPDWTLGNGPNDAGACLRKEHIQIDPYAEGRPANFNYKLLISAIVPRPIGFVSTRARDGSSTNLAPFSYFQMINHDPPLFVIGYSGGFDKAKDSLRNLQESDECCVNIISEHYVEAANACSINAPYGVSEWALSGLHGVSCSDVKASRVQEAVFAVECKLVELKEFESRVTPGKKTGVLAIVEGVKFWVQEDAINEEKNLVDPNVLRPIARLGGITYGRVTEGFEIPRPDWDTAVQSEEDMESLTSAKGKGQ